MAENTPGLWEVYEMHFKDVRIVQFGGEAHPVATIATMGNWLPDEEAEQRANARLIAVAPELGAFLLREAQGFTPDPDERTVLLKKAGLL